MKKISQENDGNSKMGADWEGSPRMLGGASPLTAQPLCRTPHLNNKQNKNTNPASADRFTPHSALPIRGKTNKQQQQKKNNSAHISPYLKLIQTTGPTLGGWKPKGRKNSTFFKERIQLSLKPGKRRPQTQ